MKTQSIKPTTETSVFTFLREMEQEKKTKMDAAKTDIQKRLQSIADDLSLLNDTKFLEAPEFGQALDQMGLTFRRVASITRRQPKELSPVGDSPTAKTIVDALKSHGKPMDVDSITKAVGGKKSTIGQYTNRLVKEGLLERVSRGMYNVK